MTEPMPSLASELASVRARRGRSRVPMPVAEKWRVVLSSNQRGLLVSRKAATRAEAFSVARCLIDEAEDRGQLHAERFSIELEETVGG
jgi:hypothetical protein